MSVGIGRVFERAGKLGGQPNTTLGGAGNTVLRGPRHDHLLGGIVTGNQSTLSDPNARIALAVSLLSHRELTPETRTLTLAALRGSSLPELAFMDRPSPGDA